MRRAGVVALAAAAVWVLAGSTAVGATPAVRASLVPVTITATSIDVDSLVYAGTVDVQTATGTVAALELDLAAATFHQLSLTLPCLTTPVGGLTGGTTTTGTTTAATMVVYATEVVATIDGTQRRISSSDPTYLPPPAGSTLVSQGTVVDPSIVSVLSTAPSLRVNGSTTAATFCSPGAGPALKGAVPFATPPKPTPTPTATPSETPAPSDAPTPSDDPAAPPASPATPQVAPSPTGTASQDAAPTPPPPTAPASPSTP